MQWRIEIQAADVSAVTALVTATGFFSPAEIAIAGELVEERLQKGAASGYDFVLAERDGRLLGYACYGLAPGTDVTFDLYWIAVDPGLRRQGLGREILARVVEDVARRGGTALYADTSARPQYAPTRAFYERSGFEKAAELSDFYCRGDGKVIYRKAI